MVVCGETSLNMHTLDDGFKETEIVYHDKMIRLFFYYIFYLFWRYANKFP